MKRLLVILAVAASLCLGGLAGHFGLKEKEVEVSHYNLWAIDGIGRVEIWGELTGYATLSLYNSFQLFRAQGIKEVHVFIMSPGGIAVDAFGVCDIIEKAKADGIKVVTIARGAIWSGAVPIFLSGSYRIAGPNTVFMLHKPERPEYLDENDLESFDLHERLYISIVANHCDLTYNEVDKLCTEYTWFTAEQAKRYGMVDEIS